MNRYLRTALALAFFACACLLTHVPASAQSVYGSIFGTVTDTSGAAIPNAEITVRDEAKGTVVTATSNGSGDYSVPHLIPDVYDLKVTAKGFKVFEAKGISVEADTAPRIDPTLQIGAENTTVEVNADSQPELKTDRADVSTVFDQQQVSSLPVGDQNFTNLQLLLPGAQLLGWSHAADENPQGSKQIQVDGQAFGGTAFELDGTDNQDPILGIIVINPAMDAVTETKITTQNFDAELGKAVSAVVTAQTRSGTNNFHGSAYDFRTGNANVARDPFSEAPGSIPAGLKNRFGGSIGGPAIKDKLFFFANYEAQRQKVGTAATDTLPTALLTETALGNEVGASGIAGADFSEYLTQLGPAGTLYNNSGAAVAPGCGSSGAVGQPYPCNVVPKALLSPQSLALLKILEPYTKGIGLGTGVGKLNGLDSNFNETGTGLFNSNQWTERVDYTLNERMHAFERFSRFWDILSGTVMFGAAGGPGFGINNYGGNSNGANDSLASGMDIALSPKLLTDFRLGYYRYNVIDTKHDQGTEFANQLGIPGINIGGNITSGAPGFAILNLPGGSGGTAGGNNGIVYGDGLNINRCNCPLTEREDQFQIVNNWTKVLGNHTVKVGADLRYGRNLRVPSDNDRAGQLNFIAGPTQSPVTQTGGLGLASFMLGDVTSFNRYVSTSTNAKEFQKRTFFYGQDTWRVTHKLQFNLGLRWELYFPESVNGAGNGSLLDLNDGYLHVAGIGGVPSDLGWQIDKKKMFAPRIGVTYQVDDKTVVRAGYGRSFDTGVFGSIFGHTVTQNIPVLANQQINQPSAESPAFTLAVGPSAYVPIPVPSNGLLPNPGASVSSSARNQPLNFPTIDAWNLSVERSLTPTTSLTVAYVGNKGTHTLGDGDSNGTNPNESFVTLPGANSVTGQALHYDPAVPAGTIAANGGTSTNNLLQRYFAAKLPACSDPNYVSPGSPYAGIPLPAGACGWTNSIAFRGDTENTEFDALQVTLAQAMKHGLSLNVNYQWASAFADTSNLWTWSHVLPHLRDSQVRDQQLVFYGSYDLPFGRGKEFVQNANHATDLLIGGYQLSWVGNWSGGLPFSVSYNECGQNVNDSPNPGTSGGCVPNATGHMKTHLTSFVPGASGTGTRMFYPQQTTNVVTDPGTGVFSNPGLDNYGNAGLNTYRGPTFFSTDLAVTKAFTIWENVVTKFRMDAFNAFNHITAGNPSGNIESTGTITSEGGGCGPGNDCGPRQLEFSLRVQF
jgi:Carboxypeptidase regulatory-like domain/TonB dependent receptor